ncbi:MAG: site-specific integrase [Proteobacteria bacterium]|nr:MAG: site-specific integrase [Pseudomonadota bacterium]
MAITLYMENDKKYYEVYVNGADSRGQRFQRRKRGIESMQKAKTIEFEFKRELAKVKEQAVMPRWHEWFAECLSRMKLEYKPSTIYNYQTQISKWVSPHWKDREINQITKADVHEMIYEKCSAIVSQNNRKTVLKLIRRLFEMAVDEGLLNRNPCNGIQVRVPEVEQAVLTSNEVEHLLKEAQITGHRFADVWALALMTGMRSGELYALSWSDVDLETGFIRVKRQWSNRNGFGPTKSRRNRMVPISDELSAFLKRLKLKAFDDEFVLPRLGEWKDGYQAEVLREFCMAIGVTSVKFHDLRATFITNLLARGVALARVMAIVGHSQIATTNVYLRKAGVDLKGATDDLGYTVPESTPGKVISLLKV